MDETDWKIIIELHKTPNITRTAERLFMTQPTLSKKLQLIERSLGAQLVQRFSKGIVFTPEGEYVAEQAAQVMALIEATRGNLLRIGDGLSGTIRLGMTNAFTRFTMPPLLMRYKERFPGIDFDIATDVSSGVIRLLEEHQIHIGFIRGDIVGDFEREMIGTEQACLVSKTPVELAELPNLPQITYLKDPFAKKLVDDWWYSHFSVPPRLGVHANHGDTCHEMIANGLGYGIFLSPSFIDPSRKLYRTNLFYKDGTPLVRNSWMVWPKAFADTPLIRNFIDYLRETLPSTKKNRRHSASPRQENKP